MPRSASASMCGICGIIDAERRPISEPDLLRMRAALDHRGPDDRGAWQAPGVGLAATRLAVVDVGPAGHMPMSGGTGESASEDAATLVFNGEIYNFRELRAQLEARGHTFRSSGDSEVVLRAYLEWGDACCERLDGMFSFAIWDARTSSLFAARDRLGVKPFFYTLRDARFAFASEIHPLYAFAPAGPDDLDPSALDAYLGLGYLPPDRCLIASIHKLPPAHRLRFSAEGLELQRYWQLEVDSAAKEATDEVFDEARAHRELDERLAAAVEKRLHSDVPLGCFLSGGIDSGLVTALAARQSGSRIHTFSVGFENDPGRDERPLARLVAQRYDTKHTELTVAAADREALVNVLHNLGEPFADIGALPMIQISRAAKRHITVALSGDGGDESFAGYGNVLAAQRAERLRRALPRAGRQALEWMTGLAAIRRLRPAARANRWLESFVNAPLASQFSYREKWRPERRAALYGPRLEGALAPGELDRLVETFLSSGGSLGDAEQHLFTDLQLRLPGLYLPKVDIASSAAALEVRSPFLDHQLVTWAARIPVAAKLKGGRSKGFLRDYARRHLPAEVVSADKRGFAPDVGQWLRGDWAPWARHLVETSRAVDAGIFSGAAIAAVHEAHQSGRDSHGARLWSFLAFEIWWRLFVSHDDPL